MKTYTDIYIKPVNIDIEFKLKDIEGKIMHFIKNKEVSMPMLHRIGPRHIEIFVPENAELYYYQMSCTLKNLLNPKLFLIVKVNICQ